MIEAQQTYRTLDDPARYGPFSLAQWAQIIAAAFAVVIISIYSPLPTRWSITGAVILVGAPVSLSILAEAGTLTFWGIFMSASRWRLSPKQLLAGSDPRSRAVVYIHDDADEPDGDQHDSTDLANRWGVDR